MLALLFVPGTLAFIVAAQVWFVLLTIFVATECFFWSSGILLLYGGLFYLANPGTLDWVLANPWVIAEWFLGYVAIGVVWSFVKWFFHVLKLKAELKEYLAQYPKRTVQDYVALYPHRKFPPSPGDHKGRIVAWIAYWPPSAVWTLIDDPISKLANWLYVHVLDGTYRRISAWIWRDIDLTPKADEKDTSGRGLGYR